MCLKKTFIALMALSGISLGNTIPTDCSVIFADKNGATDNKDKLTGNRSHLIFDDTDNTLESWMIEFQMTDIKIQGNNVFFATSHDGYSYEKTENGETRTVTVERAGLGIMTWFDNSGITISLNGSHVAGADGTSPAEIKFTFSNVSENTPITLRFAYDAVDKMAYLYMLGGEILSTFKMSDTNAKYGTLYGVTQEQVGTDMNNNDINEKAMFWTDGGESDFKLISLTDMSAIAGNSSAFKAYVIPEPTTATLSLLALAGLAARRRRK